MGQSNTFIEHISQLRGSFRMERRMQRNIWPFLWSRLVLVGLGEEAMHSMPHEPSIMTMQWTLMIYAILATGTTVLPSRVGMESPSFAIWIVDVFVARAYLAQFYHPGTVLPAFLPLLAFESEHYWPKRGRSLGGLTAWLVLLSVVWSRVYLQHGSFPIIQVCFWSLFFLLFMITRPVVSRSDGSPKEQANTSQPKPVLTAAEQEVYRRFLEGTSLRRIAQDLHVSYSTVKTHMRNARRKGLAPTSRNISTLTRSDKGPTGQ